MKTINIHAYSYFKRTFMLGMPSELRCSSLYTILGNKFMN